MSDPECDTLALNQLFDKLIRRFAAIKQDNFVFQVRFTRKALRRSISFIFCQLLRVLFPKKCFRILPLYICLVVLYKFICLHIFIRIFLSALLFHIFVSLPTLMTLQNSKL